LDDHLLGRYTISIRIIQQVESVIPHHHDYDHVAWHSSKQAVIETGDWKQCPLVKTVLHVRHRMIFQKSDVVSCRQNAA
jgi:hypothetical protein